MDVAGFMTASLWSVSGGRTNMRKSISMITGWSVKPEKVLRDIFTFLQHGTTSRGARQSDAARNLFWDQRGRNPECRAKGLTWAKIEIIAYRGSQGLVFRENHERLITRTKMVNIKGTRTKESGSQCAP